MTRLKFAFGLDALLLAAYLLLLSPRMTGLPVHEWIGIAFGIPLIVHLLLSWSWIATATRRVIATRDRRAQVNFALTATLFVLIVTEIVSGLAISQVTLPFFGVPTINDRSWRALHNLTLNWTHLAVGVHVALNWPWIVATWRKRLRLGDSPVPIDLAPSFLSGVGRIALVLLAAGVVAAYEFARLGLPSELRRYDHDEIARFRPTVAHGIGQLVGEALLLVIVAYAARRWFRVRL
jgi:hypothetical protein